jgi:hypothetical protein
VLQVLLVAVSLANAAPAPTTVTFDDSGKTITIAAHQRLQIELYECGNCGSSWVTTLKPDPNVLTRRPQVHKAPNCPSPYPSDPRDVPCVGGHTTVFRYEGKAAGRTTLRLGDIKPGNSQPSKNFRLNVRVR